MMTTSEEARSERVETGGVVVNALAALRRSEGKEVLRASVELWKRVVAARGVHVVTVTRRAVRVTASGDGAADPWARAVWALGRTASAECGEVVASHVMVDVESVEEVERAVEAEMGMVMGMERGVVGREVAYREGERLVGELRRVREWPTGRDEYVLEFGERGAISKLRFGKREVSKLAEMGEGEVEVEVEASALNFRDVLNVLGMYPGDAGLMGLEFAGRVRASKVAGDGGGQRGDGVGIELLCEEREEGRASWW